MEVKIGVQQSVRELGLESAQTPDEVATAVAEAIASGGLLSLDDEKGRRLLVPADKIAYVEIGPASQRRVGFGSA